MRKRTGEIADTMRVIKAPVKTCGQCALLRTRRLQIGEEIHVGFYCEKRGTNGYDDTACRAFVRKGI